MRSAWVRSYICFRTYRWWLTFRKCSRPWTSLCHCCHFLMCVNNTFWHDGMIDVAHTRPCPTSSPKSMHLQRLLRTPTDNTQTHIQLWGLYPCDPRYAHAPPSVAFGSARAQLWRRRVDIYAEYVVWRPYGVASYRLAYSASFVKWDLDYDFKHTSSLFDDFDHE
jgi:hypothetical protein